MKFDAIKKCRYDFELEKVFNKLENMCNAKGLNVDDYLAITGTEFSPMYVETFTYKADGELCSIIFVQLLEEDRLRLVEYDCKKDTLTAVTDWYATAASYDENVPGSIILYKDLVHNKGDLYFGGTLVKNITGCHVIGLEQIDSCIFIPYDENENIKGIYAYTSHVFSETFFGLPVKDTLELWHIPNDEAPMYRKIESGLDLRSWFDTIISRMSSQGMLNDITFGQVKRLCVNILHQLRKFGIR